MVSGSSLVYEVTGAGRTIPVIGFHMLEQAL